MGVIAREKPPGSGVWWVFINHQGRRRSKKIGQDEKLARDVAKKIEARLVLGDMSLADKEQETKAPLFGEYAALWLEGYIKPLRRPSTVERYRGVLEKYIKPIIGQSPIDQIKRGDIRDLLLKTYKQGLSKGSVCIVRDVLSGVMGYAVDEELMQANPVIGVTKRLQLERDKRTSIEPLNHEEVNRFLGACRKYQPDYYPLFLTAFRTGMRLGELLGLQWGDIDWRGKFIHVQRSFKNGRMNSTKTGRTRRVDMSDQLVEVMSGLYLERKKEALQTGAGSPIEFVFHKDGVPIAQNSIRNVFKRILRKAELRDIRIHDIRHTYASLLLSNGQSPVYVKEQLGHSSIQITVDVYGHLIPSSNRAAVNQLDQPAPIRTLYAPTEKAKAATR